tara:strand:- start:356 stop:511 length:156 start_codon:yes stop_codon:yes gene_type:complete
MANGTDRTLVHQPLESLALELCGIRSGGLKPLSSQGVYYGYLGAGKMKKQP